MVLLSIEYSLTHILSFQTQGIVLFLLLKFCQWYNLKTSESIFCDFFLENYMTEDREKLYKAKLTSKTRYANKSNQLKFAVVLLIGVIVFQKRFDRFCIFPLTRKLKNIERNFTQQK